VPSSWGCCSHHPLSPPGRVWRSSSAPHYLPLHDHGHSLQMYSPPRRTPSHSGHSHHYWVGPMTLQVADRWYLLPYSYPAERKPGKTNTANFHRIGAGHLHEIWSEFFTQVWAAKVYGKVYPTTGANGTWALCHVTCCAGWLLTPLTRQLRWGGPPKNFNRQFGRLGRRTIWVHSPVAR